MRLNSFVTSNSGFVVKLLKDSPELRECFGSESRILLPFIHLDKPGFSNFLNEEISVVPLFMGVGYYLAPGMLAKDHSFDLRPRIVNREKMLQTIVDAYLKILCLNGTFDSQERDFWRPLLKGIDIDLRPPNRKIQNFYSVVNEKSSEVAVPLKIWATGSSEHARALLTKLLLYELNLKKDVAEYKLITSVIGSQGTGMEPDNLGWSRDLNLQGYVDKFPRSSIVEKAFFELDESDLPELKVVQNIVGLQQPKNLRQSAKVREQTHLSVLSPSCRRALDKLSKKRSISPIIQGLEDWLRGFTYANLQNAALNHLILSLGDEEDSRDLLELSDRESNPDVPQDHDFDNY
jgi:hypothetical protein